jgi:activator of 2-hydroxyglutaryl-CoA dehydratase
VSYYCGIDIGASAAKLAIIDDQQRIVGKAVRRSGVNYAQTAQMCRDEALAAAGLDVSQIRHAVATG